MDQRLSICQEFVKNTDKHWNYITPFDFYHDWYLKKKDFLLLDLRQPSDFKRFHIPGAVNSFWLDLFQEKKLQKLPRHKPIFLICYVGHTSSQALVLLRILGFQNVISIKFGYGISPSFEVPVAGWVSYNYPICGSIGIVSDKNCKQKRLNL